MPRKSSMKRGAFQYQNAARVGGRSPGRRTPCRELSVTVASSRGEHTSHTNGPNANIDHAGELCPLDRHGNNKTLSSVTLTRLHYPPCAYCSPRRPADAPRPRWPRSGSNGSATGRRRPCGAVGSPGRSGTTRRATPLLFSLCRPCDCRRKRRAAGRPCRRWRSRAGEVGERPRSRRPGDAINGQLEKSRSVGKAPAETSTKEHARSNYAIALHTSQAVAERSLAP
jgi:hypothetical protein